jgi:hypothetical protein
LCCLSCAQIVVDPDFACVLNLVCEMEAGK